MPILFLKGRGWEESLPTLSFTLEKQSMNTGEREGERERERERVKCGSCLLCDFQAKTE